MADDDSSELSSLSSLSPVPSEDESDVQLEKQNGILRFFHKLPKKPPAEEAASSKEPSPPPRKREPSPPHEYTLADNPDIALIVMFRNKFTEAFPKSFPNFGPQDIEHEVCEALPGDRVELLLCALLGLLRNRKQDVKPGHYHRALEDSILERRNQWPKEWGGENPLSGGKTFISMTPEQRLTLLRTLVHWTLASSEVVRGIIAQSYKQNRHEDDANQPLAVLPWGSDGDRRRYYLIEGLDDTAFRVYRESNPAGFTRTWWSVAGNIEELKALAEKLETQDGGPKAKALAKKITESIPRFEATEEKRRRREYRQIRKLQFKRPQPGFSLYEGRTRGKRVKYTFSDDEDDFLTDSTTRRSTRNRGSETAPEQSGPVVTASGRQVRAPSRLNAEGANGDSSTREPSQEFDVDMNDDADAVRPGRRSLRHPPAKHQDGWQSKGRPKMRGFDNWLPSDEEDEGTEPDFGDDEEEDEHVPYETDDDDEEFEDEAMDEDDEELAGQSVRKSFPVTLRIRAVLGDDGKYHKVPSSPRPRQPSPAADPLPRDEITVSVQAPPANDAMTPPPTLASSTATQASTATPVSTTTTAPNSLADAQQQQQQQSMTPRPSKETTPELAPTTTMPSASLPGEGLLCEPPPAPKLPATPPHAVSGTAAAPTSLAFRGSPEKVQPPPPLPPQVL